VDELRQKLPEIVGVVVAFVVVIVFVLGIVYGIRRRSYSVKAQRTPLDVSDHICRRVERVSDRS